MSYLPPNPAILPDGQEVKVHGSEAFPFAVYCGIIPTFIPAYPLHYHEEMELIYCETGSGSITIDRATVTLHTGDVAVILPGQIHAIAAAGAGTFRYYNILFRFSLLEPPDSETYRRFLAPLADGRMEVPAHIQKDSPLGRELLVNVKMLIENRKENTALRIKACLYGVMDALCKAATPARHPAGAEHPPSAPDRAVRGPSLCGENHGGGHQRPVRLQQQPLYEAVPRPDRHQLCAVPHPLSAGKGCYPAAGQPVHRAGDRRTVRVQQCILLYAGVHPAVWGVPHRLSAGRR